MSDKLDKIADTLTQIQVDVAEIRTDLNYHIKRTDLLEESLAPIKKHVDRVQDLISVLKWAVGSGGLLALGAYLARFM